MEKALICSRMSDSMCVLTTSEYGWPADMQRTMKTEDALKILRVNMMNIVKKYLEMYAETAEKKDDYKKHYEQSGKCLKPGAHEG